MDPRHKWTQADERFCTPLRTTQRIEKSRMVVREQLNKPSVCFRGQYKHVITSCFAHLLCPTTKSGGVSCYTLRTFECLSVRPSAVYHSCPLHNFDTVRDYFTKLGTNIKHDQTTCRDLKRSLHLHFLRNYSPL